LIDEQWARLEPQLPPLQREFAPHDRRRLIKWDVVVVRHLCALTWPARAVWSLANRGLPILPYFTIGPT